VFAFAQVTGFMAHEHSFTRVLQGMIVLGLLWWSWVSYAWLGNQTHVDEGIMRLGLSAVMVAMFIASLAIPEAFTDLEGGLSGPLVLALAYFVVRLLHLLLYLYASVDDKPLQRQVIRTSVAMFSGSALIIAGAVIGGPSQTWF
jgi:low temperature requirement protein LtrA